MFGILLGAVTVLGALFDDVDGIHPNSEHDG